MIGRKLLTISMALALGMSLLASPAHAVKGCSPRKNHTKGCKNEIVACRNSCIDSSGCNSMTGKDKRKCKSACKKNCKSVVTACRLDPAICTSSPSGAFLP
jgi:hypothetical protein